MSTHHGIPPTRPPRHRDEWGTERCEMKWVSSQVYDLENKTVESVLRLNASGTLKHSV